MPRSVLIVDDERDTNDLMASLVQARGFQPIQYFDGGDVVAAVRREQPALVLLDLMLPNMHGFEVCERLKFNRETNLIPIVGVIMGVMLGEPLSLRAIIGGVVVLVGVWLTSRQPAVSRSQAEA